MTLELREPANLVSPKARSYWYAKAAALWAVIIGVQVAVLVYSLVTSSGPIDGWHVPLLIASAVLAAGHILVMPPIRYRVHRWEATPTAVYTQSGWISRERRIAPLSRVQTVDTEQGAIARLFGLAKVTVTTASAAGPVVIDGLDYPEAVALVDRLTVAAAAERGDAT